MACRSIGVGVIVASMREKRFGVRVGRWFFHRAKARADLAPEFLDLRELALPEFRSGAPPRMVEDARG